MSGSEERARETSGPKDRNRALARLLRSNNPAVSPDEAMAAVGSGLGSAGFFVIGDDVEPVSVARFLAIESCGQCTHCK